MSKAVATIREVRTDFRSVKRKLEAHGEVIITDNGVPSFILRSVPTPPIKRGRMPDYHARLVERQPRALSARQTRKLHEENRGDR